MVPNNIQKEDFLNALEVNPKKGSENLTNNGNKSNYKLLDFWRWSVSDILSNATRGRFAEFIVGTAIGLNLDKIRDEWNAYDLKTENGIKIEVKSAAYIQSWKQNKYSSISFSIKPSRMWEGVTSNQRGILKRHADVYVFCHLKHKDQKTINPLKLEQWDFYVVPTIKLDNLKPNQKSITLDSLKKLATGTNYSDLKAQIEYAFGEQETYLL